MLGTSFLFVFSMAMVRVNFATTNALLKLAAFILGMWALAVATSSFGVGTSSSIFYRDPAAEFAGSLLLVLKWFLIIANVVIHLFGLLGGLFFKDLEAAETAEFAD